MPPRKVSTPVIGAAYGALAGTIFVAALAALELISLLPSRYPWLAHGSFRWLENAAVAYSLLLYAVAGALGGALVGAAAFWILSMRGRLTAVKWGWLPFTALSFALLLVAGGKILNVWIIPHRVHFSFYIWNGVYTVLCLAFVAIVGAAVRGAAGLSAPRPKPRVGALWRRTAVCIIVLGVYFGASVALVAWTGSRDGEGGREAKPGGGTTGERAAPRGGGSPGREDRPNVLLVVIETTRADHVTCYGYDRPTTPNIDRWMAGQGALFENAVVQAPFSGPSKASIATGRYPQSHGVRDHLQLLPYEEVTLAELFKKNGYATAGIGAGAWEDPRYGYHQGFDSFRSITASYDRASFWPFVRTFELSLNAVAPWYTDPDERMFVVGARRAVEVASRWMREKHQEGKPFFMHLEFNEPHAIYEPPPPFDTIFGTTDKGKRLMDRLRSGELTPGVVRYDYESLNLEPEVLEQTIALYDGEIAYVDHELGRLFDEMSRAGYLENTVIVVTADHGEDLGEHGIYFCHTFLYDASVKVPLLLRYPKRVPPGTRVEPPVELIDIFPTVAELAGISVEALPLDGSSLLTPLRTGEGKPYVFTESRFFHPSLARYKNYRLQVPGLEGKWRSVRHGDLKLIMIPTLGGVEWEMYDLASDPGETKNLAGEHPMEETLRKALEDWMASARTRTGPARGLDEETIERLRSLGYVD